MAAINNNIFQAKDLLDVGKLVAIPTETVYGLAGNALNERAVIAIFETKNRPAFDPLIIHTNTLEKVKDFVIDLPEQAYLLANHFWPGPLTMLLPKRNIIPDLVTSGLESVAVRIPNHPLTLQLLALLDYPLAAPSANPFGYISPTSPSHVNQQLGEKIEHILDGGESNVGIESTIIGFHGSQPTIYRLGGLSIEAIENVIGTVATTAHSSSNPLAPGMLKSHYAPRKPMSLLENRSDFPHQLDNSGLLLFDSYITGYPKEKQRVLSLSGDINEAARNLFSFLRELDGSNVDYIMAEKVPPFGLGRAINDRLGRAAATM